MNLNWYSIRKDFRFLSRAWTFGMLAILGFNGAGLAVELILSLIPALGPIFPSFPYLPLVFFVYSFIAYGLVIFLLAALCWGMEFDHGTLEFLLSQPTQRKGIWREKALVSSTLLGSLFLALSLCLLAVNFRVGEQIDLAFCFSFALLILLFAGVGGPFCAFYLSRSSR